MIPALAENGKTMRRMREAHNVLSNKRFWKSLGVGRVWIDLVLGGIYFCSSMCGIEMYDG
jgi:hypothetical protein